MTFTPAEPTPCLLDNRWITLDPIGNQQAANICRTCPALDACKLDRADKIRNDPDFAWFEGVMAGEIHNPRAERRARENARRENMPVLRDTLGRPRATHCKRDHEFTEGNTYVDPKGARICRTCVRDNRAKWKAAKKAAKPPEEHPDACAQGHPHTPENTYVRVDGRRRCRVCRRAQQARATHQNRTKNTQPTTNRDNAA